MKKLLGMSNLGYAIILVIIIAIGMIISTPMIINNTKSNVNKQDIDRQRDNGVPPYEDRKEDYDHNDSENNHDYNSRESNDNQNYASYSVVRDIEQRLNSRIDSLEIKQNEFINNIQTKSNSADKYVCSVEGRLDPDNNVVPIDHQQTSADLKSQKFVFVCQYK